MPRRAAAVTKADITRTVAALLAAGVKVSSVRLDAAGVTILTDPVSTTPVGDAHNAADVFDTWMREQGDGRG